MEPISVVIPAYNEEDSIGPVIHRIRRVMADSGIKVEVVVVVDGATDRTAEKAACADQVIVHPQNLGYGRSLKTGILAATNELIAITDADGTYPVERLPEMIERSRRFHMVVGARTGRFYQGSLMKRVGRFVFRHLSEFAAGQGIPDINSGLRVFRRSHILPYYPIISAGFSFTTTSTLAYLLNDLLVDYLPIEYHRRVGSSKVRHLRDTLRALQIVVEAILRCNPMKIFLLLSVPQFLAALGLGLVATALGNWTCLLAAILPACTGTLTFGMGSLAVSLMPRLRVVDWDDAIRLPAIDEVTTHVAA